MRCKVCGTSISRATSSTPNGLERKFFEADIPQLKKTLEKVALNLSKINEVDDGSKMHLDKCIRALPDGRTSMNLLGSDFFQTRMGHTFFEVSIPQLIKELKRLNENLEDSQKERTAN